jgi:aspartate/methionine/tyrosine aminotransferase
MLQGLQRVGLPVPVEPDGAFYAWADCRMHGNDSWALCHRLMEQTQVVLTPGRDFGPSGASAHLRLSFASALPLIEEAMSRLRSHLDTAT